MAITSGFFNSINGDRKYNANQMNSFFEGLVGKGVFENVGEGLKVTAAGGMNLRVGTGKLIDNAGRWMVSDSAESRTVQTPDVTLPRYDAVMAYIDNSTEARRAAIYIRKGTPQTNPTKPTPYKNLLLEEFCLAYIYVAPGATAITQSQIIDARADGRVCGFVTSLIDQVPTTELFDQYQTAFEESRKKYTSEYESDIEKNQQAFDEWFTEVKDTLATATIVRPYNSSYVAPSNDTKRIPIGISQYVKSLDILTVYVNGIRLIPEEEYTIESNTHITLKEGIDIDTLVAIEVLKSIDCTDAETLVGQVQELQEHSANLDRYIYYTTGRDDNLKLSEMVKNAIANDQYKNYQVKIEIVGDNFAVGTPISGSGEPSSRYKYFEVGVEPRSSSKQKIILDFGKCNHIEARAIRDNSLIFYGSNVQVENLKMSVDGSENIAFVENPRVWFKNCYVVMEGRGEVCFARSAGEFDGCRIEVTSEDGEAYCFAAARESYIRATGCTCLAYTGASGVVSAAGYSPTGTDSAVLLMTNCICPQVEKYGYNQSNSIKINSGKFALYGNVVFVPPSIYGSAGNAGVESGTVVLNIPL